MSLKLCLNLILLEDTIFQVVEQTFCTYFFTEIMIRFGAFESKRRALMDPWFLFDAALVANMVVETWLVPIIIVAAGTDAADVLNISFLRMMRALAENSLPGRGMNRIAVCTKEQYEIRIMKMHEVSNGVQRVKRCPTVSVCNAMKGMVKLLRLSRISRLDLADICLTPC